MVRKVYKIRILSGRPILHVTASAQFDNLNGHITSDLPWRPSRVHLPIEPALLVFSKRACGKDWGSYWNAAAASLRAADSLPNDDCKSLTLNLNWKWLQNTLSRAAERIFIWGAKTKKGTVMSKRAPTVYMRIIITNALMKHYYRHKVSFYMLSEDF